jgi:phosphoglycerol transferase MdoB-like AlkP superfamily enzyme
MARRAIRPEDRNAGCGMSGYIVLITAFVVLKLTHVIDWSWWWVLTPLWVMFALMLVIMAVYATLLLAGVGAFKHWFRRNR